MVDLNEFGKNQAENYKKEEGRKAEDISLQPFQNLSPGEFFVRNAAESVGEMFGIEKSPLVREGEREYPALGLASEFLGTGGAYGAAFKLGRVGKYGKFVEELYDDAQPVKAKALQGIATFAPFEVGRTAASAIINPDKLDEVAYSAAFNTLIEGGLGAAGGFIKAAGKRIKESPIEYVDMKNPPQLQIRELTEKLSSGVIPEKDVQKTQASIAKLRQAILTEEVRGKNRQGKALTYIGPLESGKAQALNRLFRVGKSVGKSGLNKTRLISSSRDFATKSEAVGLLEKAGLNDHLDSIQFPRAITFENTKAAKNFQKTLLNEAKMSAIGDGIYWNKEKNGLYVIAKKVEGVVGKEGKEDKWVLFKTDNPARFSNEANQWAKAVDSRTAWLRDRGYVPKEGKELSIFDETYQLKEALPLQAYADTGVKGYGKQAYDALAKRLGVHEANSELGRRIGSFVNEYLTPTMHQFRSSPRARYIHTIARATFDKAQNLVQEISYGKALPKGKSIWKGIVETTPLGGGDNYKSIIDKLTADDLSDVLRAWNEQWDLSVVGKMVEKGEFSVGAQEALTKLQKIDDYIVDQIRRSQKAAGQKDVLPIKGHYGLSRTWEGDWRIPLTNSEGKLVYVASGKNKNQAENIAEKISQDSGLTKGKAILSDTVGDVELAARVSVGSPEYMTAAGILSKLRDDRLRPREFKRRSGVGGWKDAFTKDELVTKLAQNAEHRMKYVARLSVDHQLDGELMKLGVENPDLFRILTKRIEQLSGNEGEITKQANILVDKIASPVLGKNSASKIVSAVNGATYHLQLGMGNIAFPVINALTFVQTVMPEAVFLTTASRESLAKHSAHWPVMGSDGKFKGGMGFLDTFKMMYNSLREMGKPDETLLANFNRAVNDGVIDPKFIEETIGENSRNILSIRDILSADSDPYSKLIKGVGSASSFLPGFSEKFARSHAFTVGHIIGRDFFGMEGDQLYRAAKDFTEKTMFMYGASDRALIMTGPMGRLFGLFKNWQAHYIGSMLEYAGEGFLKGNWNPLLWQMGGTAALGGVSALPLYHAADSFAKFATNDSLMENIYEAFGGDASTPYGGTSDALFLGLPSLFGVSLSEQASAPLSDPARDAAMLFSFVQYDRAKAIGNFAGKAIDKWFVTGEHPIDSNEIRDSFIKAFAPKAIARSAALTEENAIKSLNTGNKLVPEMNIAESMMYQAGFMPRRAALVFEANEQLYKEKKKMTETVQNLAAALVEAQEVRDSETVHDIYVKAMRDGVDISRVLRSADAQRRGKTEDRIKRVYDNDQVLEMLKSGIVR